MERRLLKVLGSAAKHILHSLRRAFIVIAITGLVVALIAGAATEVAAAFLTHSFPSGPAHLAAAALAVSFGYAAAMTVAIAEILRGIILAIELVVEESEKLAGEAVHEAEVLARKAEEEFVHLGRSAVGDAGAAGRGLASLTSGIVGGIAGDVRGVEHGIASRLPTHNHNAADAVPATLPAPNATSNS